MSHHIIHYQDLFDLFQDKIEERFSKTIDRDDGAGRCDKTVEGDMIVFEIEILNEYSPDDYIGNRNDRVLFNALMTGRGYSH